MGDGKMIPPSPPHGHQPTAEDSWQAPDREIDVTNDQWVGARAGRVVVSASRVSMTPAEAVRHAAWLVCVATVLDPSIDVDGQLKAVRST